MNYKHLSKYHYIYRILIGGDMKAHVEKFPIAYSNKFYIYVIIHGGNDLKKLEFNRYRNKIYTELTESIKNSISNHIMGCSRYDNGAMEFWFLIDDPTPLMEYAEQITAKDITMRYLKQEKARLEVQVKNDQYGLEKHSNELIAINEKLYQLLNSKLSESERD